MSANFAALLYLVSGVLFILSLRGLSSPATSQAGARNGMIGMAIAIATTLWMLWDKSAGLDATTLATIVGGIALGGIVGGYILAIFGAGLGLLWFVRLNIVKLLGEQFFTIYARVVWNDLILGVQVNFSVVAPVSDWLGGHSYRPNACATSRGG